MNATTQHLPGCPSTQPTSPLQSTNDERPKVANIFRRHGDEYRSLHSLSSEQHRLLNDIQLCRTAYLGGYLYACPNPDCSFEQPRYNSCNNRGCPNCQALAQAKWIAQRTDRILPVGHHHVVTTLQSQLRPFAHSHSREIYELLFSATSKTLMTCAEIFGFRIGVTAVLHTWTRENLRHPHIHCVVTAGGLTFDDTTWIDRSHYLFPEALMKKIFRDNILIGLEKLRQSGINPPTGTWNNLIASIPPKGVIFIEAPLGTSTHVISYLGRYVNRIAISDQRLVSVTDTAVTFRTNGDATVTIPPLEFIRRFLLHVLPHRFRKIRHIGLYAPSNVNTRLERARELLASRHTPTQPPASDDVTDNPDAVSQAQDEPWVQLLASLTGHDPLLCPRCGRDRLLRRHRLPRGRSP